MLGELPKKSAAILKYNVDWASWLGSDTLATSVFTVPAGITIVAQSNTTTVSTAKISGGTVGTSYTVTCTITTTTSTETMVETFSLRIE